MEEEMLKIENNEVACCDENAVEVVIPDGMKVIKTGAFDECKKLEKVVMPDSITQIESCAFCQCSNLKEVVFSKNLKEIGSLAFSACVSLKSLDLPEGLQKIEALAFLNCRSLKKLFIPKNVNKIEELLERTIIEDCDNLEILEVDKENKVYDSRDNCNCIIETAKNEIKVFCKNSTIPASVTAISDDYNFGFKTKFLRKDVEQYERNTIITTELERKFNVIKNQYLQYIDMLFLPHLQEAPLLPRFYERKEILKDLKIELSNEKQMIEFPNLNFINYANEKDGRTYILKGLYDRCKWRYLRKLRDDNRDNDRHLSDNINSRNELEAIRNRLNPPPTVMLGCYDHAKHKVVLYIKSILEASQKENVDFIDYILSVFVHELFHAYHAYKYSQHNDWVEDASRHSLIVESLASYVEYLFTKTKLKNKKLANLLKESWEMYSMLVYPYAGAKVICFEENKRYCYKKQIRDIEFLLSFNGLDKRLYAVADELEFILTNLRWEVNWFSSLFNHSLSSLESAEIELLNLASKYGLLL